MPNSPLRLSFLFVVPLVANSKLVRLNTLSASASNFKLNRSVSLKVFARVKSVCQMPGPTNVLRPRLPEHARHGAERTGRLVWPPAAQPFAHVLWLKLPKRGTLLFGRVFRPRVSRQSPPPLTHVPFVTSGAEQLPLGRVPSRSAAPPVNGCQ